MMMPPSYFCDGRRHNTICFLECSPPTQNADALKGVQAHGLGFWSFIIHTGANAAGFNCVVIQPSTEVLCMLC